jgi:arylsulfatase A-like enzyme
MYRPMTYLSVALMAGSLAHGAEPSAPMNVLMIIADDLNTRLGCYGETQARTPTLDRLASQSVVFDRCYAPCTVCTPSRKALMTGLAIHTVGADNSDFMEAHPDQMTMPRWFREHGYQTVKVGKVEHGDDYAGPHDWEQILPDARWAKDPRIVATTFTDSTGNNLGSSRYLPDDVPTADQGMAAGFKRFVTSERDPRRPFFFALGLYAPHTPYESQARHRALHPMDAIPLPGTPAGTTPMSKPPSYQARMIERLHTPKPGVDLTKLGVDDPSTYNAAVSAEVQRTVIRDYDASVSMMDEALAGVMETLETTGLAANTIVLFTSDQGYFLGYRGMWMKHYLYPDVLRVPMLVRIPGVQPARAGGIVELIDTWPTLSELAGLPRPPTAVGASFANLVRDPTGPGKPAAYAEGIMFGGHAVVTRDNLLLDWTEGPARIRAPVGLAQGSSLKILDPIIDLSRLKDGLTIRLDGHQRWIDLEGWREASREFYDLSQDPRAWHDKAGNSSHAERIAAHAALMKAYFDMKTP